MRLRTLLLLLLVAFLAAILTARVHAQTTDVLRTAVPSGIVRGDVLDAADSRPIERATVVLTPASPNAVMPSRDRSSFVSAARTASTDAEGRYRFTDVTPGTYKLLVQRVGYRATALELALEGAPESRVSVGLEVAPLLLTAMRVEEKVSTATVPGSALTDARADSMRLAAVRARQQQFLSADAREVTPAEVQDAATLGEADLLRALTRLPGVAGGAAPNVRGARWDLSRVYFDGVPLFAPYHLGGALTGFPADAIGLATVLPGVRPASYGDGAAGVFDLRSRSGTGNGRLNTRAELSVVDGSLSLDQRRPDGSASWYVAARGSMPVSFGKPYGGRFVPPLGFGWTSFDDYFADLIARGDMAVGRRARLETSALVSRDALQLYEGPAHSGEVAARATLDLSLGASTLRQTIAYTGWGVHRRDRSDEYYEQVGWSDTTTSYLPGLRSGINRLSIAGEFGGPRSPLTTAGWRLGYDVARTQASYEGSPFTSAYGDPALARTRASASHVLLAGWGERRWHTGTDLEWLAGLRAEGGSPVASASRVRLAPRLEGRYRIDSLTSISAALGRHWQYAQALYTPFLLGGGVWRVAGAQDPAARVDVATLGVERWLPAGWLASGTLYARRTSGVLLFDELASVERRNKVIEPGWQSGGGGDFSLRKLTGRVTGSAGYSLAREWTSAFGLHHISDLDVTQRLDLTAGWQLTSRLRAGAAYGFASGGAATPGTQYYRPNPDFEGSWLPVRVDLGPLNSARSDVTHSLDALFDWSFRLGAADGAAYVQFRDLLYRMNRYTPVVKGACVPETTDCPFSGNVSSVRSGMYLPIVGLRFRF